MAAAPTWPPRRAPELLPRLRARKHLPQLRLARSRSLALCSLRSQKGVYHYKVDVKKLTAVAMGEMAEELPECSGGTMSELEKAMFDACKELSGFPEFKYECSPVTPKVALFTACIGTQK